VRTENALSPIEYVGPSSLKFPAIRAAQKACCFFLLKMSKKSDVWFHKETLELLAAWGAEEIQKNFKEFTKTRKSTRKLVR
jgi:hypothetical protein